MGLGSGRKRKATLVGSAACVRRCDGQAVVKSAESVFVQLHVEVGGESGWRWVVVPRFIDKGSEST